MKVCNNCYHIIMYQNKNTKVNDIITTNGIENNIRCEKCGKETDQLIKIDDYKN